MALRQRQPRIQTPKHLSWIRTLPCVVTRAYGVEAAHIRFADMAYGKRSVGMGEKPDDKWVLPLSPIQHRIQHSMGEVEFWQTVSINPLILSSLLWCHSGNTDSAIEVIRSAKTFPPYSF